ncbi:hypothetical protein Ahia01_001118700 [Argonauta hians]
MQLASRGNQELDRLKCADKIKSCKKYKLEMCKRILRQCSDLKSLKACVYMRGCEEYHSLLNTYYTSECLKTDCASSDTNACPSKTTSTATKDVCDDLDDQYRCVQGRNGRKACIMSKAWRDKYSKTKCEQPCYKVAKPPLTSGTDEDKCNVLNRYLVDLESYNCNTPDDMKKKYDSLKCGIRCNKVSGCSYNKPGGDDRKLNCYQITLVMKCLKDSKCPIEQNIRDDYSLYGCETSCNSEIVTECSMSELEPANSTRAEQCGYLKHLKGCGEKSKCQNPIEKYDKLECDAAVSQRAMFSLILSAVLAVQMLEKYISFT